MGDLSLTAAAAAVERNILDLHDRIDVAVGHLSAALTELGALGERVTALEAPAPPPPDPAPEPTPEPIPPPVILPPAPRPIFVEEWDGPLDPARWEPSLWGLRTNKPNELQSYLPGQVSIKDGYCTLRAERGKANIDGMPWVSGIVSTRQRLAWLGGRFEIRAKLPPQANGGWAAGWLFPESGDWYRDGEIDFYEALLQSPDRYSANVHWHTDPANHAGHQQAQKWVVNPAGRPLSEDFHTYGCIWTPGKEVVFTFDGSPVHMVTGASVPARPMYLIVNLAISSGDGNGGWGKPPDATTPATFSMVIDSVRVWA